MERWWGREEEGERRREEGRERRMEGGRERRGRERGRREREGKREKEIRIELEKHSLFGYVHQGYNPFSLRSLSPTHTHSLTALTNCITTSSMKYPNSQ